MGDLFFYPDYLRRGYVERERERIRDL